MKFSVLMSVYKNDNAQHLKTALESIYDRQTLKPDEIVVVFDGPLTDALYTVLKMFRSGKEDIVFYFPQEVNRGLGEALRIGSEHCHGDYILRMDSDDISAPQRFQKQISYITEHPDIAVLGTYISEFNESPDENMRIRMVPTENSKIIQMGKHRNPMNHVSVCIQREALNACGGYETLLLLEDYYLWLKLITGGCKLENLPESLVYVRVGNEFNTKRGSKTRISGWKVLQNYMLHHGVINRYDALQNMFYIYVFIYMPNWMRQFVYRTFLRK